MYGLSKIYKAMRYFISLLLAVALLSSCALTPRLVILHVNDTHSHFEPDRSGPMAGRGGVLERAAFVDSVRNACGEDKVLLVHGGDFSQGSSYFTIFEGLVETDMMNALRYDCSVIGNHEFDNNIEALTERAKNMSTPLVCANLDFSQFELGEYVTPYRIVEKGGMKIGIIGLVPDLAALVSKTVSSRIPQIGYVEAVNKYTAILRDQCDMLILLSHAGIAADTKYVPMTHGLDLVIGAHSHTNMKEMQPLVDADGKTVPMITDWCFGYNVGVIKVY